MYIGSIELTSQVMWTYDSEQKRMVNREVKYVPGFFKIVDEILVNAADHKVMLRRVEPPQLTHLEDRLTTRTWMLSKLLLTSKRG
jgi:hypothetical protein